LEVESQALVTGEMDERGDLCLVAYYSKRLGNAKGVVGIQSSIFTNMNGINCADASINVVSAGGGVMGLVW